MHHEAAVRTRKQHDLVPHGRRGCRAGKNRGVKAIAMVKEKRCISRDGSMVEAATRKHLQGPADAACSNQSTDVI